ncbi:tyrosine-type recombinase/integrase [Halorarum salinum]|uniref:tyrosine-type recombinase/integrase n=1 Tax=Halorarum salinum TaxID=2743089 RepID=UPI001FE6A1E4|nr:site-specific integrase [Halobaculum salinum]
MFDADMDPLEKYTEQFEVADVDPFEPFLRDVLGARDITERTVRGYKTLWDQWCAHMDRQNRHPACPNAEHVKRFAHYELMEKGNNPRTVSEKLRKLTDLYQYWQDDPVYPHPINFNPICLAEARIDLSYPARKDPPRLTISDLEEVLRTITHVRDYAIVLVQLKLGLRATEVCNLRLADVALSNQAVSDHYCELGTNSRLAGRDDAIFIPHIRKGNKSRRPRLLPLDDETQQALVEYLLVRPNAGDSALFLSKNRHGKLRKKAINAVWKDAFHPAYAETEQHRAVTSHFGRHRFTTYWRVEQDLNRELIKYMRGDAAGSTDIEERGAIDEYIHSYYEDIESVYRNQIYTFDGEFDR